MNENNKKIIKKKKREEMSDRGERERERRVDKANSEKE